MKKNSRRLNTSCPENSEYVKTKKPEKNFFIIKEEEEYKKNPTNNIINNNNNNKIRIPSFSKKSELSNSNQKGQKENSLNREKMKDNSLKLNNIKLLSGKYAKNSGINSSLSKTPDKKVNKLLDSSIRQNSVENNNNDKDNNNQAQNKLNSFKIKIEPNSKTPIKNSNYANYKLNLKNYSQVSKEKTLKEKSKRNTSLNSTLQNPNSPWVNKTLIKNTKNTPINNNDLSVNLNNNNKESNLNSSINKANLMRKKIINITNNMDKEFKNTISSGVKNSRNKNQEKLDVSPLKIPTDKKAYNINNNNKAKNININFYQNIIINNSNKKTNNASGNNSMLKDDEENNKINNLNLSKESYYLKGINKKVNNSLQKTYSNRKNERNNSVNNNVYNIETQKSAKTRINNTSYNNNRLRSTSISQSISDKNSSDPSLNNNGVNMESKLFY